MKASKFSKTLIIDVNRDLFYNTNIFPDHNLPFIQEVNIGDEKIFPRDHKFTCYGGDKIDGKLDAMEFGEPLGKISHTEELIKYSLTSAEESGSEIRLGERVKKLAKSPEKVSIYTDKGNEYSCKLLVLATGSRGFELQRSLGFEYPDSYTGLFTHLYGDEDQINDNFYFQYMFHVNPKISQNGPFYFNVGKGRVSTGFLGNQRESDSELASKMDRILQNYKKIQPYLKGLKKSEKPYTIGKISKHPIKKMTQDRVLVIGEAAGLVTAFFYEGILCGLASADIAAKAIEPLIKAQSNFNNGELYMYQKEVNRILLKNYFRNGDACEYLFYNAGSNAKLLWDTYTNLINTNRKLRKQVWEAYKLQDLANYDTNRDRWAGEQLFSALPTLSKITLSPRFFKAMLK